MSGPNNPFDWWWRMWFLPSRTYCQLEKKEKADQEFKRSEDMVKKEVPQQRHAEKNFRMVIKAFIERLERGAHVIFF